MVVRSVIDARAPKLGIVWEKAQELPVFELPADAQSVRQGALDGRAADGRTPPRRRERCSGSRPSPAFVDTNAFPTCCRPWPTSVCSRRSGRTACGPSSIRPTALASIVDYFAERWRKAGIAALHVAAWHYNEPDAERDEYLRKLIEACHKRAHPGLRLARAAARQREVLAATIPNGARKRRFCRTRTSIGAS